MQVGQFCGIISDSFSCFKKETVSDNLLENDAASALNAPLSRSEVNRAAENLDATITLDSGALLTSYKWSPILGNRSGRKRFGNHTVSQTQLYIKMVFYYSSPSKH